MGCCQASAAPRPKPSGSRHDGAAGQNRRGAEDADEKPGAAPGNRDPAPALHATPLKPPTLRDSTPTTTFVLGNNGNDVMDQSGVSGIHFPDQDDVDARDALAQHFPEFLAKYELDRQIGSGLGSTTFLIKSKDAAAAAASSNDDKGAKYHAPANGAAPEHRLCVKVTRASANEEDTKQHWKEVVAMQALTPDEHITELIDHYMNQQWSVMVLRVMEGGDIKVGEHRWGEAAVASIAQQVLIVLDDMHAAGYTHLDIKPQHILTEREIMVESEAADIHVRLCGFSCCTRFKQGLNCLGEIPESPLYIAPEIWKIVMGVPSVTLYDERCDIWSLGVVLYVMLSAQHPFLHRPLADCSESDYLTIYEAIFSEDEPTLTFPKPAFDGVSHEARHFLLELLQIDFRSRCTASAALQHPFIRKYSTNTAYLTGLPKVRIMFNFEPERTDLDMEAVNALRQKQKTQSVLSESTTMPVPYRSKSVHDTPPVSPSALSSDSRAGSRRRKMSWHELEHDQALPQLPLASETSKNSVKSPKLFLGSPVKHSRTAMSPHLNKTVDFPKERFSPGEHDAEDGEVTPEAAGGSGVFPDFDQNEPDDEADTNMSESLGLGNDFGGFVVESPVEALRKKRADRTAASAFDNVSPSASPEPHQPPPLTTEDDDLIAAATAHG